MTSRDGYNRNRPTRGSEQAPRESQRQGSNWELDAAELDRYMSGQPSKEPRFDPYGRSQSTGRTERVQPQRQYPPSQPVYDDYAQTSDSDAQDWGEDDYGYEDNYEYDDYQDEVAPPRTQQPRRSQNLANSRTRVPEPEYDDDLYDDPYVLDDEDAPRRPQRRTSRSAGRERPQRQAPSFTLPPAIADAPVMKDSMVLGMFAVAFVSIIAMLIVVATRGDGLDALIFTHVNANGEPENLRGAGAIWNLPLIASMVTLISGVLAWFLARWGEFLPRFLIGGAIGVQFVVWVAVIAYLF